MNKLPETDPNTDAYISAAQAAVGIIDGLLPLLVADGTTISPEVEELRERIEALAGKLGGSNVKLTADSVTTVAVESALGEDGDETGEFGIEPEANPVSAEMQPDTDLEGELEVDPMVTPVSLEDEQAEDLQPSVDEPEVGQSAVEQVTEPEKVTEPINLELAKQTLDLIVNNGGPKKLVLADSLSLLLDVESDEVDTLVERLAEMNIIEVANTKVTIGSRSTKRKVIKFVTNELWQEYADDPNAFAEKHLVV